MSLLKTLAPNQFRALLARQFATKTLVSSVSNPPNPSKLADEVVAVDFEVKERNLSNVNPKLRSLSSIFANPKPELARNGEQSRKSIVNRNSVRRIDEHRKPNVKPSSVSRFNEPCEKTTANPKLLSKESFKTTAKTKQLSNIGKPRKSAANHKRASRIDKPREKSCASAESEWNEPCKTMDKTESVVTVDESRKFSGASFKEKKTGSLVKSSMFQHLEERQFPEELSNEVAMLVNRLRDDGYLKEANFSGKMGVDAGEIPVTLYSRHFLKSAAEKFGDDHQEIAKWLSGSDLKKVALFGCPSIERKTVFAAKRLRSFFKIQEDVICRGCKLKSLCKFVNQRVGRVENVILSDTLRILTLLALEAVPKQLSIPSDLKSSICKLLGEIVNLSDLKSKPTQC